MPATTDKPQGQDSEWGARYTSDHSEEIMYRDASISTISLIHE
jgi:hypothetical protein